MEIFLGPPGTGKTTTLLNEVDKAIEAGAQARDLACQNIGPPLHRRLLGSNICAAFIHVGDPAFRLASALLPSPDFGKRDCTSFARVGNALFK